MVNRRTSSPADQDVASFGIEPGRLYTTAEAAAILRIQKKTLVNWRWQGGTPEYHVIGCRCVRYSGSALIRFVTRGKRANTSNV